MDWSPFLVGGATRPDAITGLQPQFRDAVWQMLQDAQQQGVNLRITSAYRSPEVQARLWENALAKYGSPEAARKWVAPPGKSRHNAGTAADFAFDVTPARLVTGLITERGVCGAGEAEIRRLFPEA
jgi:uncharacterized protein YcbK (DUF882 family)